MQYYGYVGWYLELFPSTASETGIISEERTDRNTDSPVTLQLTCDGVNCVSQTHSSGVRKTCALYPNFNCPSFISTALRLIGGMAV